MTRLRRAHSSCTTGSATLIWSTQEGTPAADMPDRCSEAEALARQRTVTDLQEQIMDEYDRSQIGKVFQVLCEGKGEDGRWAGRRYADSPDVDEQVLFTGEAMPGDFVRVRIDALEDGYLTGETV